MSEPAGSPDSRAGFSAPDDEAGLQLRALAGVTAELGAAASMAEIVEAAVEHAASALGAAVATLLVRDGDRLSLIGNHGLSAEVADDHATVPIDDGSPAGEAMLSRRPVLRTAEEASRYPVLRAARAPHRSFVGLPFGGAVPVGVICLTFEDDWLPGPQELDFLTTFAAACGQAIGRVTAAAQAAERQRQLEFLAEASVHLAASLDLETTLDSVARLVVPGLADWCSVEVLDGDHLRTVAIAHADPAKVEWAWALRRRYPPAADAPHGIGAAIRTGRSELIEHVPADLLRRVAQDAEHLRMARQLGLRSAMVVPLVAPAGRVVGAMNLSRSEDPRPYTAADLALAEDLGRRAGLAVENAELHRQARDTAEELQRAVLPAVLDDLPGWEVATHYETGGRAGVGGDFYGASVLPDGRLAVFVGDVIGHGVPAAAAMAQLRTAVRAFLTMDPDPAVVVGRLRRLVRQLDVTPLLTLAYAVIDRAAGTVTVLNAGHLAPLVVRADGTTDTVTAPMHPPLGIDAVVGEPAVGEASTPCADVPFADGDVLLMVTDGLVERRGEVLDVGLRRLATTATELRQDDLDTALAAVIATLRTEQAEDDAAAIAVRARR